MSSVINESPTPGDTELRGRLIGLGIVNNFGSIVTLGTGLVMVPVMLSGLGQAGYGAWIMVMSVSGLVMSLDLGLSLVVTREVARVSRSDHSQSAAAARAAGGALLLVGVCGFLALTAIGFGAGLPGSDTNSAGADPAVFVLVGLALLMEQATQYCLAVLGASLRFGLVNLVQAGGVLLRAILITTAFLAHAGLAGVAFAYAAGAAVTAAVAASIVRRIDPAHALREVTIDFAALRPQLRIGLASLIATAAGAILWHSHPLIIGALAGPDAVVVFFIGMRVAILVSESNWRTAEVLFPVVSANSHIGGDTGRAAVALSTGVRWLSLIVLPVSAIGCVLAPWLLEVWLGVVPAGASTVMRIGLIVVLFDAWAVAAMQVLWGLGRPLRIAVPMAAAAAMAVALDFILIPTLGPLAGPVAMSGGLVVLAAVTLAGAAQNVNIPLHRLLTKDISALLPAGVACAAGTSLGAWAAGSAGAGARVLLGSMTGILAYAIAIRYSSAVAEEKTILTDAFVRITSRLRVWAKDIAPLRSAWYLMIVLRRRIVYQSASTSAALDELFGATPDPWDYDSSAEQSRHTIAEGLLAGVDERGIRGQVLEIGCAEGAFTERLAARSESLLSVDVSTAALARARNRRDWGDTVRFAQLDLLRDPMPGRFTCIVVMDVLTYFESVSEQHALRSKIVDAIEPGGWLLVGDVRQSEVYETSWWGRKLLCGGLHISEFMAAHGQLTPIAQSQTETHVFRLLRKDT